MCTEICGGAPKPRSCSKICLVKVSHTDHPSKSHRVYAVLDDQSNRSLVKSGFFNLLDINSSASPYTLKTCSGTVETAGRKASNIIVESLDGRTKVTLPPCWSVTTYLTTDQRSPLLSAPNIFLTSDQWLIRFLCLTPVLPSCCC